MYDRTRIGILACAASAVSLTLLSYAVNDYRALSRKPNPLNIGDSGLPAIQAPPWGSFSTIDPSRLPWTLDPSERWPKSLKQKAAEPCGLAAVLVQRYPLWVPTSAVRTDPTKRCRGANSPLQRETRLREMGFFAKSPQKHSLRRLPEEEGWLIQRDISKQFELVLTSNGLLLRRGP